MGFKLDKIDNSYTISKQRDYSSLLKKEIHIFGSSFSNKIKEDFYTELGVLLKAGITLKEALYLIEDAIKKKHHKDILSSISNALIQGSSLSEAIKHHKPFTNYEYYSLKIGEETGTLAQVIDQLAKFYAVKNEQKRNLVNALTYPVIIISTAILVLIFMLQFVVPMFQDIFEQQNVELPKITKIIIYTSELMKSYGFIFVVLLFLVFIGKFFFNKKPLYKKMKDMLILKTPYIGSFVKTVYLSQFTQAVSLLTASKVPLVNSIQLVRQMISFYPLQHILKIVEEDLLTGKSLSNSLKSHKLFDAKMIALVKVAEETNQNEFIFSRLNIQYATEVQQRSKMLSTLMEPIIIVIVGGLVGIILIAMYLPMFKLSSVLG